MTANSEHDIIDIVSSILIRNLDDQVKDRLRSQAALHGRSMEEEARDILRSALATVPTRSGSLVEAIRSRIEPLGGVDLELPDRDAIRPEPGFSE